MARAINNRLYKDGYKAGWTDYRYGTNSRPITLAVTSIQRQILNDDRRRNLTDQAVEFLRHWKQSPFELEGSTRSGIRSALCLAGHSWHQSDHQAEQIVHAALRRLGAKRPSWEQGQRHYAEPRENCKWCGCELDAEDRTAGFCSIEHARYAKAHWGFETRAVNDAAYLAVVRAASRLALKARACECCGAKFRPQREQSDQRFCSYDCTYKVRRKYAPIRCLHCEKLFKPNTADREFCSPRCGYDHAVAMDCACCGTTFMSKGGKKLYCSDRCYQIVKHERAGKPYKTLCPKIFDHILTRPLASAFSARRSSFRCEGVNSGILTPAIFDEWFRRAA